MLGVTTYLRASILAWIMLVLLVSPLRVLAAAEPVIIESDTADIIITEVQTGAATASQEFIELHNTTDEPIAFTGAADGKKYVWKLQFFSAASTAGGDPVWTKPNSSITLSGSIEAGGYFVLSSSRYMPVPLTAVDQHFSDRMATAGGGLQLVRTEAAASMAYERVMWSDKKELPDAVVPAPKAGHSLQRPYDPTDGYFVTEEGETYLTEFLRSDRISPGGAYVPVVASDVQETDTAPDSTADAIKESMPAAPGPADNASLLPLVITELLPNPASPQTDEKDEFIEVFNPNPVVYGLQDHVLEVGITTKRAYAFEPTAVVAPGEYAVYYSSETHLALSNTASQARLLAPNGVVISETAAYAAAKDTVSWALDGQAWGWTVSPTPGEANIMTTQTDIKTAGVAAALAAKKQAIQTNTKTKKAATAKKASATSKVPKVKKAKATKAKKTTKKPAKPKTATVAAITEPEPKTMIHTGILVGVAALAVLYGAYEYRHDVANKIRQLRGNRAVRVGPR